MRLRNEDRSGSEISIFCYPILLHFTWTGLGPTPVSTCGPPPSASPLSSPPLTSRGLRGSLGLRGAVVGDSSSDLMVGNQVGYFYCLFVIKGYNLSLMVGNQVFKDDPASTLALSHQDWSALGLNHDVKLREVEEEENTSSKSWITALREVRERSREKKRLLIMSFFSRIGKKQVLFRRVVVKGAEGTSHFFHEQTYRFWHKHRVLVFLSIFIRPIWLPWATITNSKLKYMMENSLMQVDCSVWVSSVVVLLMILNVNVANDIASDIEFRFVNRLITPCDVCTLPLRGGA